MLLISPERVFFYGGEGGEQAGGANNSTGMK